MYKVAHESKEATMFGDGMLIKADLDQLCLSCKKAVDEWVDNVRAGEALATPDHSMVAMEHWAAPTLGSTTYTRRPRNLLESTDATCHPASRQRDATVEAADPVPIAITSNFLVIVPLSHSAFVQAPGPESQRSTPGHAK